MILLLNLSYITQVIKSDGIVWDSMIGKICIAVLCSSIIKSTVDKLFSDHRILSDLTVGSDRIYSPRYTHIITGQDRLPVVKVSFFAVTDRNCHSSSEEIKIEYRQIFLDLRKRLKNLRGKVTNFKIAFELILCA
jgi:hypothetical protein